MKRFAVCLSIILTALPTWASVGKVSSPEVNRGVAEVEYSGTRTSDSVGTRNNQQSHTVEMEYGFSDRFMMGLEAQWERNPPKATSFDTYGLEMQYELTTQDQWWLSSAVKAEYGHAAHHADEDEFEIKLLAARQYGATGIVGNLNFEREVGAGRDSGIDVGTALQITRAMNEHANPGIEWHADWGKANKLGENDQDNHYVGPILTGELFEIGNQEMEYTLGYYWGLGSGSADHAIRLQLGYEFAF